MSERDEPTAPPDAPRAVRRGAGLILGLLALMVGGALAAITVMLLGGREDEHTSVRGSTAIVAAVRDLSRLESVSFHMERVIELTDTQEAMLGLVEAEDSILLVAAADVIAGVDLAELREQDVVVDPETRTAHLTLPPARVLLTRLDNERTFVHSRRTDLLARRGDDLESRARQEAERTLEAAAIEAGITERAADGARRTVESLVRALGYESVVVEVREAP